MDTCMKESIEANIKAHSPPFRCDTKLISTVLTVRYFFLRALAIQSVCTSRLQIFRRNFRPHNL